LVIPFAWPFVADAGIGETFELIEVASV